MLEILCTMKEPEITDQMNDQSWENLEIWQIDDVVGQVFATKLIKKGTLIQYDTTNETTHDAESKGQNT